MYPPDVSRRLAVPQGGTRTRFPEARGLRAGPWRYRPARLMIQYGTATVRGRDESRPCISREDLPPLIDCDLSSPPADRSRSAGSRGRSATRNNRKSRASTQSRSPLVPPVRGRQTVIADRNSELNCGNSPYRNLLRLSHCSRSYK